MSYEQSQKKQKKIEQLRKHAKAWADAGLEFILVLNDFPKWAVYYNNKNIDDPMDGSWNYNCFENAAIYKVLRDGIT